MIHLRGLPSSPHYGGDFRAIIDGAATDARALVAAGFRAAIIENMHDRPYLARDVGPAVVAAMTAAAAAVRRAEPSLQLGVQVLCGANREAMSVALAVGASFIRADGFAFSHVSVVGLLSADAGPLLRFRKEVGAEETIAVLADIKKKHSSHAITADMTIADMAREATFCGADALVVTGDSTGHATDPEHVASAAKHGTVFVGSGVRPDNLRPLVEAGAHGLIVGSDIKVDGHWSNPVDPTRAAKLYEAWERTRSVPKASKHGGAV